MKHRTILLTVVLLVFNLIYIPDVISQKDDELKVKEIRLDYPCPAIPFYHFFARFGITKGIYN
jgi:hypothetical protein